MQEFYRNLWERKMSKSEALRQAQLVLLKNPSLIDAQQENLIAQIQRSRPDLSRKELTEELARTARGLLPGETDDIEDSVDQDPAEIAETSLVQTPSTRTHPALWAAFILNGAAR
jgi:CHAT domain-containing protein